MKRKPKFFFQEYLHYLENSESKQGLASYIFLDALIQDEPRRAWSLILELIDRAPSEDTLGNLAAGHLEDCLKYHPGVVVDGIEQLAEKNERFRRILKICWLPNDNVLRVKIEAINKTISVDQ